MKGGGRKGEATMTRRIRAAVPYDLDTIRRIARAAYMLYVPRIGREPAPMVADFAAAIAAGRLWAAGSPVTAFVVAYPREEPGVEHWHLENVVVNPAVQSQGLGGALISHVEDMARASGARAVELYTNAKMTENQSLYPRLGYAETGREVENGFDRVFYR
jgi:GNAT superfamily N-acetyltransferase